MTKAELVEEVARAAELNKRDAEVIVETVFDSIITALHKGEKVELRGFGSFRTRERGPRRGRNPKTGEPVDVPAKRVPYFKPGKELKEFFTDSPDGADEDEGDTSEPTLAPPTISSGDSQSGNSQPAELAASGSDTSEAGDTSPAGETEAEAGSATSEASGSGSSSSGSAG